MSPLKRVARAFTGKTGGDTRLEGNLRMYAWMKTFTKRVYYPVISIMLVMVAHLSLGEIAFIGAAAAVTQGILQLPTGYIADKFGNRKTMLFGSILSLPATLFYIFLPNFWGGLLGLIFYSAGIAFINGAGESLMYGTLVTLGRVEDYAKEVGRAQSIALGGNFVLVALVPLTYAIDYRVPLLLGFICALLLVFTIVKMVEPSERRNLGKTNPIEAMRKIVTWQNVSLFIFAGFTGGFVERSFDFLPLSLTSVGIAAALTGLIVAISSVVGAVLGWYVYIFDRLKPTTFYIADLAFLTLMFGLQGVQNAAVVVSCFVLLLGYVRVRYIVFQSKLLHDLDHRYKATLISTLSFFSVLGSVFSMIIFGRLTAEHGYMEGLKYFAATMFAVGTVLLVFVVMTKRRRLPQVT